MKLFQKKTNNKAASSQDINVASLLMDVVPLIMSWIRTEMRSRRTPGLSIPEFRTLIYLYRHDNASLSQVSDHIGLKLPSTSKLIEALVIRKLVFRKPSSKDRRYIRLRLSASGVEELMRARHKVESLLSELLSELSAEQQLLVSGAINTLHPLFASKTGKFEQVNNKSKNKDSNNSSGG